MTEDGHDLVARVHREFIERNPPPPLPERPTIHYTELPPSRPGDPLAEEWETYRREVGRLLAEGNEGRYVLIFTVSLALIARNSLAYNLLSVIASR